MRPFADDINGVYFYAFGLKPFFDRKSGIISAIFVGDPAGNRSHLVIGHPKILELFRGIVGVIVLAAGLCGRITLHAGSQQFFIMAIAKLLGGLLEALIMDPSFNHQIVAVRRISHRKKRMY